MNDDNEASSEMTTHDSDSSRNVIEDKVKAAILKHVRKFDEKMVSTGLLPLQRQS